MHEPEKEFGLIPSSESACARSACDNRSPVRLPVIAPQRLTALMCMSMTCFFLVRGGLHVAAKNFLATGWPRGTRHTS